MENNILISLDAEQASFLIQALQDFRTKIYEDRINPCTGKESPHVQRQIEKIDNLLFYLKIEIQKR